MCGRCMATAAVKSSQSMPGEVPCNDANHRNPSKLVLLVLIRKEMLFNESKKRSGSRMHRRLVMRH